MAFEDAHKKGKISELKAQAFFLNEGYDVFTPVDPHTRADFVIVRNNDEVWRVQVKTVQENRSSGFIYLQSRLSSHDNIRTYTVDCCDIVVFVYKDRMWVAPIQDVSGLTSVCLDKLDGEYSPNKRQAKYDPKSWEVTDQLNF